MNLSSRTRVIVWQLAFILLGTSWLWAPYLNPALSYRTSLISQYEAAAQPYSWLFRLADVLSAILLVFVAANLYKARKNKVVSWLLLIIGIGMVLDPLFSTTCRMVGSSCVEYVSAPFLVHAVETVVTAFALFTLVAYDAWVRKKLVSTVFVILQIGYGGLFLSQLADRGQFNTLSQIVYQTSIILWLAWFYRDFVVGHDFETDHRELKIIKLIAAAWAFLNGILAILISLMHIHLLGNIHGLYFVGDNAWLAQHSVIIGVILLYLSRHLARGELRARQIFLALSGIEVIKYAVIAPHAALMALYLATFCALFVLRDDFKRGVVPLTWETRVRDLYFMLAGLLIAALAALLFLDRDDRVSVITSRALDNFRSYAVGSHYTAFGHHRSALLAHTISAFLLVSLASILWILFKPYKAGQQQDSDSERVKDVLKRYSNSSEDYFKLWPTDKTYWWQKNNSGFIAYKQTGPVAFALADPISKQRAAVLKDFILWTRGQRLTACFLPVYETSLEMYAAAGLQTIQIGSSASINIQEFLGKTVNDKWWRWQKNRAEKSGYSHSISTPPHSPAFLQELEAISDAWLEKAGRSEYGLAMGYFDKPYLQNCNVHYLTDDTGKVIAFTNEVPQLRLSSVVTVDLLRYLPEANNAMPFLLLKTIASIPKNNPRIKTFDLGFVPFAKAKGPIVSIVKTLSAGRFSARGLEQFKNKFNPAWVPNYMAYDGDLGDLTRIALNIEKSMKRE